MKQLTPIILLIVSVGLYFTYIEPTFENVLALRGQETKFDQAKEDATRAIEVREKINTKYRNIDKEDIERLQKFLPNSVNNGQIILDIDKIASKYGIRLNDIRFQDEKISSRNNVSAKTETLYKPIIFKFKIETTYNNFLLFIKDMEKSLQLMDINEINVSVVEESNIVNFNLSIVLYALEK